MIQRIALIDRLRIPRIFFMPGILFFCFCAPLFAGDTEVMVNSNYLEYQEQDSYMVARGSVVVTWEGKSLTADSVEMSTAKNYIIAHGSVTLTEAGNVISGESISYDLKTKTGSISKAKGAAEAWFYSALEAKKLDEKQYDVIYPRFTTCNLQRPHYTIKATSAKIHLNKNILLYNAVLYFRKIPSLYFPVLPIGLGPHKHDIKVDPGYNNTDGVTMKIIWGYPITDNVYTRLYYDYYSMRGNGTGGEVTYNAPTVRGSVYTYQIKDKIAKTERYTFRANHWQKLDLLWYLQSDINYQSDTTFNNEYFQENWNKVNQSIDSNLSATRQDSAGNFRVSTALTDVYNQATGAFEPSSIVAPSLTYTRFPHPLESRRIEYQASDINIYSFKNEFSTRCVLVSEYLDSVHIDTKKLYSVSPERLSSVFNELIKIPNFAELVSKNLGMSARIPGIADAATQRLNKQRLRSLYPRTLEMSVSKNPIYTNYDVALTNSYTSARDYYAINGSFNYAISKSIRANRSLSLTPRFTYLQTWVDRTSKSDYHNIFQSVCTGDVTARQRVLYWMDWDWSYAYAIRGKQNDLSQDYDANDYGVQRNTLSFFNSMYPTSKATIRNSISYGLQDYRNGPPLLWWQRFSSLVNELTWMPTSKFNIYAKETNVLYPSILQSVQTLFSYTVFDKHYLNTGFFYQAALPGQLDMNAGFGFTIPENIQLDYVVNASLLNNYSKLLTASQEVRLTKVLHCWDVKLRYRKQMLYEEIYVQVELYSRKDNQRKEALLEKEREFYPWR